MRFRSSRVSAPLGALLTLCIGSTASAIDAEGARREAQREIQNVQRDMATLESKLAADQRPEFALENRDFVPATETVDLEQQDPRRLSR